VASSGVLRMRTAGDRFGPGPAGTTSSCGRVTGPARMRS